MQPISQSHQRYPLTRILGTPGQVRLLRELVRHGGQLAAPQLARTAGLTAAGARRALQALVGQGVVTVTGQQRGQLYRLNHAHPLGAALTALFDAEALLWEQFWDALRQSVARRAPIAAAWLYGSAARGEDRPDSDIDVLLAVAGKNDVARAAEEVREAMHALEDRYGTRVSVIALSAADIRARAARGDAFWASVVADARPIKGERPRSFLARRRSADTRT